MADWMVILYQHRALRRMGLLGLVPLVSVMILSEPRHVRCIYMYIYMDF